MKNENYFMQTNLKLMKMNLKHFALLKSRRCERRIRYDLKKWKKNSDKIRQNLVEALCDNQQTKLMGMEFQDLPTGNFYYAVKTA